MSLAAPTCCARSFTPETCNAGWCVGYFDYLAAVKTPIRQPPPPSPQPRAALLLRGRHGSADLTARVLSGYNTTLLEPLRAAGFVVDSFIATYDLGLRAVNESHYTWTDSGFLGVVQRWLSPVLVQELPVANGSNLRSTVSVAVGFDAYRREMNAQYDVVIHTRLDLLFKHPLPLLPHFAWPISGRHDAFYFPFKESWGAWRDKWPTADHAWRTGKRTSDTIYVFSGALLPCVLCALEHYMIHPGEQLHYLYKSIMAVSALGAPKDNARHAGGARLLCTTELGSGSPRYAASLLDSEARCAASALISTTLPET